MSSSAFAPVQPRNSEDKLYQACLAVCIEGIEKLKITRPRTCSSTTSNKSHLNSKRAATSPTKSQPALTLPSPPPSPQQRIKSPSSSVAASISASSLYTPATMDRSSLHGAPRTRGQPIYGNPDARPNLAVQPAANRTTINLKKGAVKIVGTSQRAEPVASQPKPTDGNVPSKLSVESAVSSQPKPETKSPATPKVEISKPEKGTETDLDTMFARLMSASPSPRSLGATKTVGGASPARPDKSMFPFEDRLAEDTPTKSSKRDSAKTSPDMSKPNRPASIVGEKATEPELTTGVVEKPKTAVIRDDMSKTDLESEYINKAVEYLASLPTAKETPAETIKTVVLKLRSSFSPTVKPADVEDLKSKCLEAIAKYVNSLPKNKAKTITPEFLEGTLKGNDGNFLRLCAALVDEKVLQLENLDEIVGLCKAIMGVLPKDPKNVSPIPNPKPVSKDPMDNISAWPTCEKRENAAACRTCILKGVSSVSSINQLQALVWGGRLESISLPEAGADYALVKFLTPEACQKYFEATENGIEVPGDKKVAIFVERQPGPNSINDVIRNCIEGDASRCVRAFDADEDWGDVVLLKLARGKGQSKREVDRIKRGKTAKGRYYIEFRFANIYHALNFRRALMDDEDWEHCTIGYAPDPCETARGIHFKDEDE